MTNFDILEYGPVASPAKCLICGYGGMDRKYLDPRKDFEFYGTAIICEECVGAMSQDFGFLQPVQARVLELRVEEAETELVILRAAVVKLEDLYDVVNDLHSFRSSVNASSVVVDNSEGEPGPVEQAQLDFNGDVEGEGSGDSTSDVVSSIERSDDVLHTPADDDRLANI